MQALERVAGVADGFDARGDERAEVLAQMIKSKEKPFAVDIGKVVRIDNTLLGVRLASFAIS